MRRALFVCLLAVTSAAVVPAAASAGTYVDYECAGPDGQPVAAAGFTPTVSPKSAATNTCGAAGGAVDARPQGDPPWAGGGGAPGNLQGPPENTDGRGGAVPGAPPGAGAPPGGGVPPPPREH